MTTLVALDGVLRAPSGNPIPEGRILLEAFKQTGPVYILADSTAAEAEHWLKVNNIIFDNLIGSTDVPVAFEPLRVRQVAAQRSRGRVDFLVDSDPDNIEWAVSEGICSVFFCHPQFAAPVSRRDSNKGRRSWDDINAEIDRRQKIAKELERQEAESADL